MKKHPIAISAIAFFLLTTGCQTSQEEANVASEPMLKKRGYSQLLNLEAVSEQNIHGVWQGKSVPYLNTGGLIIEADFIYWRVDEDGLDYVMTSNTATNSSSFTFHKPEVSWDPGYKVGIGYTFGNQDFWDFFLRWAHLNTAQDGERKTLPSDISHLLIPVWSPTVLGQQALNASVNWQVRYNTLDLELGRDYFVSKTVALRPHVGMRGASIKQQYKAKYQGELNTTVPIPIFNTHMKAKNNFKGLGARAGAQLRWHFASDWSVIGSVAGSLLYGRYDLHQKLDGVLGSTVTDFGFKDDFSKVATNLEASLGFEWEYFFSDDDYRVAISASYEFSEWFSQNRLKQFNLLDNSTNTQTGVKTAGNGNGDLGLQGGTLQVRFDF
jgi:hypothetical protein